MLKKSILALATTALAFGCLQAWGWDKLRGVGHAEAAGVVSLQAEWIKDKNDKYDVSMKITNESDATILLFVGDMKCGRGADSGGTIQVHSERHTLEFRGKESRSILMTCKLATKNKGDFQITVKAFSNPSGDSNTPGKLLAENLVWKQGQKEGGRL